jgi:predicted metalloprotease
MKWTPGGTSDDIQDERDSSGGTGGGIGPIHLGIGGTIIVGILSLVFHQNLFDVLNGGDSSSGAPSGVRRPADPAQNSAQDAAEKPEVEFVSFVLDDVQKTWTALLPAQSSVAYRRAKLVLYRDAYPSGCGTAQTSTGPFYCPEDQKVYLDLGFFNELKTRFHAPGEFAQAYVIAHELGHHVQYLLGIEQKMRRLQQQEPRETNPLSVKLELQADCFAGVWAHSTEQRQIADNQDVAAAINAAAAVGDDRLQKAGQGYVNPDSFTHGSSAQRENWFQRGAKAGLISDCNTFGR